MVLLPAREAVHFDQMAQSFASLWPVFEGEKCYAALLSQHSIACYLSALWNSLDAKIAIAMVAGVLLLSLDLCALTNLSKLDRAGMLEQMSVISQKKGLILPYSSSAEAAEQCCLAAGQCSL